MRSYQIVEWGKPLEPRDYPNPEPEGTQVLVKVSACVVCHSDVHMHDGFWLRDSCFHPDSAAGGRVLHRVLDEVRQHLLQARSIGA